MHYWQTQLSLLFASVVLNTEHREAVTAIPAAPGCLPCVSGPLPSPAEMSRRLCQEIASLGGERMAAMTLEHTREAMVPDEDAICPRRGEVPAPDSAPSRLLLKVCSL